jgi:hypothetical protein
MSDLVDDVHKLVNFVMTMDEEDGDDNDEDFVSMLCLFNGYKQERNIKWQHERMEWDKHITMKVYTGTFNRTYRMSKSSFDNLVNIIRQEITLDLDLVQRFGKPNEKEELDHIYPELVVAVSLRYFLAGGSYLDLADKYGISNASVYRCRDMFLDAVIGCPELDIKLPTTVGEMDKVRLGFARKSHNGIFKGCVGALDGYLATSHCEVSRIKRMPRQPVCVLLRPL